MIAQPDHEMMDDMGEWALTHYRETHGRGLGEEVPKEEAESDRLERERFEALWADVEKARARKLFIRHGINAPAKGGSHE